MPAMPQTILPTDQDARESREFSALFAPFASREEGAQIHVRGSSDQPAEWTLPVPIARLLLNVLQEMARAMA